MSTDLFIGAETGNPDYKQFLSLRWANRHGLIAGATGTGKTVTLQSLAEGFSKAGVPVFMADVKGDLTGICQPSGEEGWITARAEQIGFAEFKPSSCPATFWDVFGEKGHPVRTTISEIGPVLLARMLELNDTQEGVLNIAFRHADEEGLLLMDLKDLRALLNLIHENASKISAEYGQVSKPSIAAIQRAILQLEDQGGKAFFGEPALELSDLMRRDIDGHGYVNILAADKLINSPRLYATFMLWILSELFEELPEAGDLDKPRLVFFFDEAHLLFNDAPKSLMDKVEQVVRLIRSKGVGIYFVTQNPQDIPDEVLGQLGNRIQHALRAFTPKQQKFIRDASKTYRQNPAFNAEQVIGELLVGEALVSTLEEKGAPGMVRRILIRPPCSKVGVAEEGAKRSALSSDGVGKKYDHAIDRESAYEILKARAEDVAKRAGSAQGSAEKAKKTAGRKTQSVSDAAIKTVVRSASSSIGRAIAREIIRGVMGSFRR